MIPKIIHYCWFGGASLPEGARECIDSWRRRCPGYEIREWNESNFDVTQNDYCREAYEAKKWAFVADYARLAVLAEQGGIYMDTDVEVVRSFDPLLASSTFLCFESNAAVSIGTFGVEKGSPLVARFLRAYEGRHFRRADGSLDLLTNVLFLTRLLVEEYGLRLNGKLQELPGGIMVYPMEAFIAKDYQTGWIMRDETTYAIHHYAATWHDEDLRRRADLARSYLRTYMKGIKPLLLCVASFRVAWELDGLSGVLQKIIRAFARRAGLSA